jgi:hypothetical protein
VRKLLAFLCLVGSAFATSPIIGNLKDPATNAVSAGAFVRVWLRGCSSNQPRVNGTALIPPRGSSTYYVDLPADASGAIKDANGNAANLYATRDAAGTGDGDIQCGASKQAVWYGLQPYFNGIPGVETPVHAKNGVTLDFTNVTPITTTPTTTAPSGDTTYCRLDGGNCGFTGPITTTSSIQLSGGTSDTTAGAGKLYYRTDLNRPRYYDSAWHSLIAADTTDTLTGKTLTAPTITSPTTTGTDSGAEILQNKTLNGAGNGNAVSLLNIQGQAGALTGNAADQTIYTYTLPANTLGAGKGIRITYGFIKTNSAATTYKLSFGSSTMTLLAGATQAGQVTGQVLIFNNAGVQNAQTWYIEPIFQAATIVGTAGATSAVNTANSAVITLTFNVAATDSATPQIWLVELIQ